MRPSGAHSIESMLIFPLLSSSSSWSWLAGQEGGQRGHTQGSSTNQLTLWGDSGPQVLSQRTAAPHHTERYRGAAGSGPGEETQVSPKEGKGCQNCHQPGVLQLGQAAESLGVVRTQMLDRTSRFSDSNLRCA